MKLKNTFFSTSILAAVIIASPAMAQDNLLDGWSGSAGMGAVFTAGNSDTSNVSGSANVSKQIDVWRHTAFGSTYKAKSDDEESADRFEIGYKLDRQINDLMYGFGRLRYDSDEFGNVDGRFSGVVGVGRKFLDDGKQTLDGEIGIGAHSTEYLGMEVEPDPTNIDPITGEPVVVAESGLTGEDSGALLYGGLNYGNKINEVLTFNSNFSFEAADNNTLIVWDNALGIKLSDRISLSLGLLNRSNSDIVGDGDSKTDTVTRMSFVYGI